MKPLSLSYKFYILFSVILAIPASAIADKISAYVSTLPTSNFFYYLYSVGALEAPTTVAILFFFFWIFSNCLWKTPGIKHLLGIPNLNGRYEGDLTSTHTENNEQNGTYKAVIEIKQSLTAINVFLYTEDKRSYSYSLMASLMQNNNYNYELTYIYQNQTSAMGDDSDMRDHRGAAFLEIFDQGKKLSGTYFNNPRERGRYGVINVEKVKGCLKGKF